VSHNAVLEAVVVAAGSSRRMGFDKLAAPLVGRSVLEISLQAFLDCPAVSRIVLVLSEGGQPPVSTGSPKEVVVASGGAERADSVRNGLARVSASCTHVAVHDAARPLVTPAQIEQAFDLAHEWGAATLAEPCADTLHRVGEDGHLQSTVDRTGLWRMQTPQIFERSLLESALKQATGSFTDEAGAVIQAGKSVAMLESESPNFKITYARDLPLAELILRSRQP